MPGGHQGDLPAPGGQVQPVSGVGGGLLITAWWQRREGRWARQLSIVAGAGLVAFEVFELTWTGFQPLAAVAVVVGAAVLLLAATDRPARSGRS